MRILRRLSLPVAAAAVLACSLLAGCQRSGQASNPAQAAPAAARGFWTEVPKSGLSAPPAALYRTLTLDLPALQQQLIGAGQQEAEVPLPMPEGGYKSFRVKESQVQSAEPATPNPQVKTFEGNGLEDPTTTVRLELTPVGLQARARVPKGEVLVEPFQQGGSTYYRSYYKHDLPPPRQRVEQIAPANADK